MTDRTDAAETLWNATLESYDTDGLITLTNIRDRSATAISDNVGNNAALAVIDLWPIYAQEEFDDENLTHIEVGKRALIAVLWSRGGTATSIAKVEWDEVFSADGLIAKVRGTGARGRPAPETDSSVATSSDWIDGRQAYGWSDPRSMPHGYFPRRVTSHGDSINE